MALGKPLRNSWDDILYYAFHESYPKHSDDREMSGSLWKIFADHAGHVLEPVLEESPEDHAADPATPTIGGDAFGDRPFAQYLAGWPEGAFAEHRDRGFDVSGEGYLACPQCRERIGLGVAVRDAAGAVVFFHRGGSEAPANSRQSQLNRAVWRFLARHLAHRLPVLVGPPFAVEVAGWREIGRDVDFEEYLAGWPG
ncbi:hypothetical protein [Krasilnikovia sp. MM14-A1259]|uniref:hypothetical protein n=1 Tax=Krasilnikovia sp. MM14-A1259 TaxID=3373539 RepID=UPI0038190D32